MGHLLVPVPTGLKDTILFQTRLDTISSRIPCYDIVLCIVKSKVILRSCLPNTILRYNIVVDEFTNTPYE